jgi:hypothetical protein
MLGAVGTGTENSAALRALRSGYSFSGGGASMGLPYLYDGLPL